MPFVGKPYRDTVLAKCPDFLDQPVIQLSAPLAGQKCLNGDAALKEFRSVSPDAVHRIRTSATRLGSRVFHASSAMRAFCAALSIVKGGSGGRLILAPLLLRGPQS